MSTVISYAVPFILLALTTPWCLRMLRTTNAEPALNRITQLTGMTALAALGAVVLRAGIVPLWSWYPTAVAVGVGAIALSVRWPVLVRSGAAERRIRTVVSLVINGALLVVVSYGFLR
ncbi:hypothetical protein [Arthrobacter rhombi]|uniref:Uncharacterized protein n=1 Tax=Arthrobacter rhombi TaxID=71253 RepID=A0A1R4GJL4_9MICC|nr:hypothetical protein [Arthrobacter rhombi]SJM68275.1 hypothetical protein FM101_10905 [Arthrobacter rhombi]